jgi:hypothetical protein
LLWQKLFLIKDPCGGLRAYPHVLFPQENVRVVFNLALRQRPVRCTCQDYETREPLESELLGVEQSGTREWARYTAVTVRLVQAAQRGHSFRWRVYSEG